MNSQSNLSQNKRNNMKKKWILVDVIVPILVALITAGVFSHCRMPSLVNKELKKESASFNVTVKSMEGQEVSLLNDTGQWELLVITLAENTKPDQNSSARFRLSTTDVADLHLGETKVLSGPFTKTRITFRSIPQNNRATLSVLREPTG